MSKKTHIRFSGIICIILTATFFLAGCNLFEEPDNTPPVITILSPADNATLKDNDTVTIIINAIDESEIASITIMIDGMEEVVLTTPPYEYIWDCSLDFGSHTIFAKGVDSKDNAGSSNLISVEVIAGGSTPIPAFSHEPIIARVSEPVSFTDLSTFLPTQWSWDFGDGSSSTEQNPEHSYENAGTYYVSLLVSNNYGTPTYAMYDTIIVRPQFQTVSDYDGNSYKAIEIGDQVWMCENLKVTHFPNGTEIPLVTGDNEWAVLENNDTDIAYCYYENQQENNYGALYTYSAAVSACPSGWHLPSLDEWNALIAYTSENGFEENEASALKALDTWQDTLAYDAFDFKALPSGSRYAGDGTFHNGGINGFWWTSTEVSDVSVIRKDIFTDEPKVLQNTGGKSTGFSVRCVKDSE
ncbi:MAG: FISUMP domain-containing protein [Bacteroidota bacterium]